MKKGRRIKREVKIWFSYKEVSLIVSTSQSFPVVSLESAVSFTSGMDIVSASEK